MFPCCLCLKVFCYCSVVRRRDIAYCFRWSFTESWGWQYQPAQSQQYTTPDCEFDPDLTIPSGSLLPIAYGYITSSEPGDIISAAVAVGIKRNSFGVIMEFSGKCSKKEAEQRVTRMVEEAFEMRGLELQEVKVASTEHVVEHIGCAFAAVPLWY